MCCGRTTDADRPDRPPTTGTARDARGPHRTWCPARRLFLHGRTACRRPIRRPMRHGRPNRAAARLCRPRCHPADGPRNAAPAGRSSAPCDRPSVDRKPAGPVPAVRRGSNPGAPAACPDRRDRSCHRHGRHRAPPTALSMRVCRLRRVRRCSTHGNHPRCGRHGDHRRPPTAALLRPRPSDFRGRAGPFPPRCGPWSGCHFRGMPVAGTLGRQTSSPTSGDAPSVRTLPDLGPTRLPTGGGPRLVQWCAPAQPWQRGPLIRCRHISPTGLYSAVGATDLWNHEASRSTSS